SDIAAVLTEISDTMAKVERQEQRYERLTAALEAALKENEAFERLRIRQALVEDASVELQLLRDQPRFIRERLERL
ncbi:hypothetical protein HDU96_004578, partial [Phlyctochytrium bullatum]